MMRVVISLLSARIGVKDGHAGGAFHASRRSVGKRRTHRGTTFVIIFVAEAFAFALERFGQEKKWPPKIIVIVEFPILPSLSTVSDLDVVVNSFCFR